MRLNRYKAKFTGASSHHNYANFTSWLFGGIIILGIFMFMIPSPSDFPVEGYVFGCMLLTALPLFVLKLFAQEYNVIGLVLAALTAVFCAAMLLGSFYFISVGEEVHSIFASLYYGVLAYIAYAEHTKIQQS